MSKKYYITQNSGSGSVMVTLPAWTKIKPGTNVQFHQNPDGTILLIPEGVVKNEEKTA